MSTWVELAETCSKFHAIEGFENEKTYPKTCWFCEHYGMWGADGMWSDYADDWSCEFKAKETERKMKAAILFKGQTRLLEILK